MWEREPIFERGNFFLLKKWRYSGYAVYKKGVVEGGGRGSSRKSD